MGFRPKLSTQRTAGMVKTRLTIPTTPVAKREMVPPVRPTCSKMVGADETKMACQTFHSAGKPLCLSDSP
jgi:hypothetical protein